MTKERKLGFANCVSHPLSDSWVIPCSWQFSFISETLGSVVWETHWGLPWFSSGSSPASLSSRQHKCLFLNHCHTSLLSIAPSNVSSVSRLCTESRFPVPTLLIVIAASAWLPGQASVLPFPVHSLS